MSISENEHALVERMREIFHTDNDVELMVRLNGVADIPAEIAAMRLAAKNRAATVNLLLDENTRMLRTLLDIITHLKGNVAPIFTESHETIRDGEFVIVPVDLFTIAQIAFQSAMALMPQEAILTIAEKQQHERT